MNNHQSESLTKALECVEAYNRSHLGQLTAGGAAFHVGALFGINSDEHLAALSHYTKEIRFSDPAGAAASQERADKVGTGL